MKKRFLSFVLMFCLIAPTSAFASDMSVPSEQSEKPAPISVEQQNIDGTEYITKVYEVNAQTEPADLTEEDFELGDFLFTHHTTEKQVNEESDTKEIIEEVKAEGSSNKMEDVIRLFPATKTYDLDGYRGTLTLDTGSIVSEPAGYTTKYHTVSTVKEYPGLMYADPTYVAQSATKDGYTLPLTDVNWVVMATGLSGDTLVPTEYKATATYSKTYSSQVPTGYISTARYKGEVTKITEGTTVYSVTYIGMPLNDGGLPVVLKVITGIIIPLLLAGGIVLLVFYLRSRKGAEVYNFIDKEYICIGKQAIDPKAPVIDLNPFEDMIQSNVFQFILDKKTTKKLFGRNLAVTLKDVTVKHRVTGRNGEYIFELDLGGVLDAE